MYVKIWERYFLFEFLKVFFLFLICFYGLYVLIDYSSNAASFHTHVKFQWKDTITYYLSEFSKRLDVLVPFALLVSTVRVLCSLNIHNELVAMLSGGVSLKTLMRPFIFIGLLCTAFIYLNTEFILPNALKELKHINNNRSREKHKHQQHAAAQHLILDDNSILVFKSYDALQNSFFDAYWIQSADDIYRIKHLQLNSLDAKGRFVEHLVRSQQGELAIADRAEELLFPNMRFNQDVLFETTTPPIEQKLSALWKKLPLGQHAMSEKESQTLAAFYFKLVMPWLCLFAIIGPAPSCLRCTRHLPVFLIYAFSIFGMVAFYLIMDAALLLGERNTLMPAAIIGIPFGLFMIFFFWRYARV